MSQQQATRKGRAGSGRRGTQAVAGVAGAVACLGIGWAVGVRSASAHATTPTQVTLPAQQPNFTIPDEGDDTPGFQWGTVPGNGLTPAQPGAGAVPPTTGSGGSTVATSNVAPSTTSALTVSTSTGIAGQP
jgi:hypothetical protein